ncbi:1895_t:CDS:2, partial [Acaulospora colombiana]
GGGGDEERDEGTGPIPLSEGLFSQKLSTLESLIISQMSIHEGLILELRSYPSLRSLTIESTNNSNFLSSFTRCLDLTTGHFPALRKIKLDTRWPSSVKMAYKYKEFSKYCASERPRIHIYGRGNFDIVEQHG